MSTYRTLRDASLDGKRVLVRAGFDVPLVGGKVADDSRIRSIVPTIRYILQHGASVILMAHQGRPKGVVDPAFSQKPLVPVLTELLGVPVGFAQSCSGAETKKMVDALAPGDVLLLENLRFDPREKGKDPSFAKELASYADVYVNDAFANSHRDHTSMVGVAELLPSYMGLELEQEVMHLTDVLSNPSHPLSLIVSGAKIETKVPVIQSFLTLGEHVLTGGAVANTFIYATGTPVGLSKCDPAEAVHAETILKEAEKQSANIHLPTDALVAVPGQLDTYEPAALDVIGSQRAMFDIGPRTIAAYEEVIEKSACIVWNGPLGMYEEKQFAHGSIAIAHALQQAAKRGATVIIGGGDTIDLHTRYNLPTDAYTFVSTGGGAMLEFLSGKQLPALKPLLYT